jgi:hypothetical protein
MAMTEIQRHAAYIPMSDEAYEDARQTRVAFDRFMSATPEQRDQWAREAAERRAAERAASAPTLLSLDALLDKLGWTQEYATHLVQPYCQCYDGMDGWEYCEHARDDGVVP